MSRCETDGSHHQATEAKTSTDYDIPWPSYTDAERMHILQVLRRDVELRRVELERIR